MYEWLQHFAQAINRSELAGAGATPRKAKSNENIMYW